MEIPDDPNENKFPEIEFLQLDKSTSIYNVSMEDHYFHQACEAQIIEPTGMWPTLIIVDLTTEDEDFPRQNNSG